MNTFLSHHWTRAIMSSLFALCLAVPTQAQMLDEDALQKEPSLQAKVSVEISKKSLSELLELLQKQSGVQLTYTADSPAKTVRATALFNQMTLADALCALSRVYGVQWQKTEGGYVMLRYPKDDLHLRLFQHLGTAGTYNTDDYKREQAETAALIIQIHDSIAVDSWKSQDGVPFSALPTELQEQIRLHVLLPNALSPAKQIRHETKALNEGLELRLGSIKPGALVLLPPLRSEIAPHNLKFIGPGWTLYTDKGELVIPIFPEVHGPSAVQKQFEDEVKKQAINGRTKPVR